MADINVYQAAFVIGSALAIILSAIIAALPPKVKERVPALPLGGHDFTQAAIIILICLGVAAIADLFQPNLMAAALR